MPTSPDQPFASLARSLDALFREKHFHPASVQRGFEWGKKEADALFKDLDGIFSAMEVEPDASEADDDDFEADPADDEGLDDAIGAIASLDEFALEHEPTPADALDCYYLGSIVLLRESDGSISVYDGLQRLTTLTTLFCVLRDLASSESLRKRLTSVVQEGATSRLRLRSREEILQSEVISPGAATRIPKSPPRKPLALKLHEVKKSFVEKLENWSEERRESFVDFLLSRVWVNVVEPRDAWLGRQIFVSTNLHGKPLNPISILKGQISDLADDDQAAAEIGEIWDQIATDLGETAFERFLMAIDSIERMTVQGEQWPTDLGEHLSRVLTHESALRWMRRTRSYAGRWKALMGVLYHGGRTTIERNIWRLRAFHWPEWIPLALYYMREHSLAERNDRVHGRTKAFFENLFDLLHRRCMALTLLSSPGARQTAFAKALAQARARQNPMYYGNRRRGETADGALIIRPKQREKIQRVLSGQIRDSDVWAPLTAWIEMSHWRESAPTLMRKTSTEHVLPRNPADGSIDFARFGGTEGYDQRCFALGNLVVVPEPLNKELDNKPFPDKRELLTREAADYVTVSDVLAHDAWEATEIDARSERLSQQIWNEIGYKPPAAK